MGQVAIKKVLKDLGLTDKEAEIYIFLTKHGILKGGDISKRTKTHKALIYRILKSLQAKGLIESTLESPARFSAVSFETLLDLSIKTKREEATAIEKSKQELLQDWKNISQVGFESSPEKFVVIEGKDKIYAKILQMIKDTKTELSAISSVTGLLRADQFGIFDAVLEHPLKSQIQFRFLTELTSQNLNTVKALLKRVPRSGVTLRERDQNLSLKLSPQVVIKDEEEMIFFITANDGIVTDHEDATCLWTNCKALVHALEVVFEDLWNNSIELQEKRANVKTYFSLSKNIAWGPSAEEKYGQVLSSARKQILIVTSSADLIELSKNMNTLKGWADKCLSVKIMAPIVMENFEAVTQLSEFCEVRHIPQGYIETTLVDGTHLFHFLENRAFYINDTIYIDRIRAMLDDTWKTARPPSAVTIESIINPPSPPLELSQSKLPLAVYAKSLLRIDEGTHGTITEKYVIDKIMNAKRIVAKDPQKDMNTEYGTNAHAIIHPPDFFNLPDMMVSVWRADKNSSFGAEDWMVIQLWLETPIGYRYVPVAHITDNPEAAEFRKGVWSKTPAGKNSQCVSKDQFQVRVHGNTLFAGWTIPIQLFPPHYVLPPSCLLFEGYGKLRTGILKTTAPSGRTQVQEFNRFDAFVTYFHPSSKYSAPGTDGIFNRDIILTAYPPPNRQDPQKDMKSQSLVT